MTRRGPWRSRDRPDTDGGREEIGSSVQCLVDGRGKGVLGWEWRGHSTDRRRHTGSSEGVNTIETRVDGAHLTPLGARGRIDKSR